MARSSALAERARQGQGSLDAWYFRGLVPYSFWHYPSPEQAGSFCIGNFSKVLHEGGALYSDGAGGERSIPGEVRHVGAGAAVVAKTGSEWAVAGLGSAAPGRHTVCRADLAANILAAESVAPLQAVVSSGPAYTVKGLNALRQTGCASGEAQR